MIELDIQAVVAARADPVGAFGTALLLRAEVEFDRQFQVVHAFLVAQQQVEFAEGLAVLADRQVGRQQLDTGGGVQGELPETFVIQAQAAHRTLCQPVQQATWILVEAGQPVGQQAGRTAPLAGAERVALRPRQAAQQRR
ncbi:hypothetical protein D3C86_1495430 [compost metagenome]